MRGFMELFRGERDALAGQASPSDPGGGADCFAARMVFTAAKAPGRRWRPVHSAAVALMCGVVAGSWLSTRVAASGGLQSVPPPTPLPVEAIPAAPDPAPTPATPRPQRPRPPKEEGAADVARRLEVVPLPEETRFQVTRRAAPTPSDGLIAAWMALLHGDPVAAIGGYEEVLAREPENRQARLGVAAIEAQQGETEQARRSYLQLLERDPADPLALAGLLELESPDDTQARERRLRHLINRHPDLAPLQSALGRLYAREGRWADAWRAYDRARAIEDRVGVNDPDTAFNLAVALDHLGRRGEARMRYEQALMGARERTPAFDCGTVEARVRALSEI